MKHRLTHLASRVGMTLLAGAALMLGAHQARAADNVATGDVAGNGSALTDSAVFQLFSTGASLTLVKTAFLASDDSALTSGTTVPTGTLVKFVIYVNNTSSIAVNDVSIQDVLDPLFVYQAGTLKLDSSVASCAAAACTPAEETTIFAAVDAASAGSDAVDADGVSFTGGNTLDAGNQAQANAQVDVPANSVLALSFTVQVQ